MGIQARPGRCRGLIWGEEGRAQHRNVCAGPGAGSPWLLSVAPSGPTWRLCCWSCGARAEISALATPTAQIACFPPRRVVHGVTLRGEEGRAQRRNGCAGPFRRCACAVNEGERLRLPAGDGRAAQSAFFFSSSFFGAGSSDLGRLNVSGGISASCLTSVRVTMSCWPSSFWVALKGTSWPSTFL